MNVYPPRRAFLRAALGTALGVGALHRGSFAASRRDEPSESRPVMRRFTMDLTPGTIGLRVPFPSVVELAAANGFESVAPDAGYLGSLDSSQRAEFLDGLKSKGLVWGAAGLPIDFRGDSGAYESGLKDLPAFAKVLQDAGATRVGTWIRPTHASLTFLSNLKQHAERLRRVATILGDHGLRFGLEYVGPKTSWTAARYPFVHTMAEAKELIDAIDRPNVGLVLDSWHWYTAGETREDLLSLTNDQIVACDLNDAPAGIPVDQQMDLTRDLPAKTGVIDLKTFLNALVEIGYDGPVRAEPFKAELRDLPPDQAVAVTAEAMKAAFALVD